MNKIFFFDDFMKFVKKKKGVALDLASGSGDYSKVIARSNWFVESIDLSKKFEYSELLDIKINIIDLEKNLISIEEKLIHKRYDLIIMFRFLHRPLFKLIPKLLKKNGQFFCETFMIKNNAGKLNTKKFMLKENELLKLNKNSLTLNKFYQGPNFNKQYLIQSAIFRN